MSLVTQKFDRIMWKGDNTESREWEMNVHNELKDLGP